MARPKYLGSESLHLISLEAGGEGGRNSRVHFPDELGGGSSSEVQPRSGQKPLPCEAGGPVSSLPKGAKVERKAHGLGAVAPSFTLWSPHTFIHGHTKCPPGPGTPAQGPQLPPAQGSQAAPKA